MQVPAILQGDSLKRLLQGAFIGFLATVIIGFGWGGWMLWRTATALADTTAKSAVVAAIAPAIASSGSAEPAPARPAAVPATATTIAATAATAWVRPDVFSGLAARPWALLFVAVAIAGAWGALWFPRRGQELAAVQHEILLVRRPRLAATRRVAEAERV